jgi:hypothetical protein
MYLYHVLFTLINIYGINYQKRKKMAKRFTLLDVLEGY